MTYEEFKEIIEETGEYRFSDKIVYREDAMLCFISDVGRYEIDTVSWEQSRFLEEYGDVVFELASTPIEDRYPAKKYYVKPDLPEFIDKKKLYLNRALYGVNPGKKYILDSKFEGSEYQTQFTLEEIEEIIPKEDMDKFKLIPVEEEE